MTITENNTRTKAMNWWREMNEQQQLKAVTQWKRSTRSAFKDLSFEMIKRSSLVIEFIYSSGKIS